jgi:hypothetical protein
VTRYYDTLKSAFIAQLSLGHAIVSFIRAIREIRGSNSLPSKKPSSFAQPLEDKSVVTVST